MAIFAGGATLVSFTPLRNLVYLSALAGINGALETVRLVLTSGGGQLSNICRVAMLLYFAMVDFEGPCAQCVGIDNACNPLKNITEARLQIIG